MKKTALKQLIKECVRSILEVEEYDPESDSFAYAPRDRTEPVEPTEPGSDEQDHGYSEDEEIKIIKLARDYATAAKGADDRKLKQGTLVTIESMLTRLLQMHGIE